MAGTARAGSTGAPAGGAGSAGARTAGVVLAGGRSSRMGASKAALEWHGSTLLRHVTGVVARAVDGPVLVVRAPGQELPALTPGVELHDDPQEGRGPLQGLAVGLGALTGRADVAFVCSTDLPFLHVAFVRAVLRAVTDDVDVALPIARGYPQPLAAAYRTNLVDKVEQLLAADRLRPAFLFEQCRTLRMDDEALRADPLLAALDPELESVLNINEPADYESARARMPAEVTVQCYGALARRGQDAHDKHDGQGKHDGHDGRRGPRLVRAANLGEASAAISLSLDRHVLAAVNGDQVSRDPEMPLTAGDTVAFLSADAGG